MDFDLPLFERLNEEYRDRPLVPVAPSLSSKGRTDRARALLKKITGDVQVAGKRVLEIGTAKGHLSALLVGEGGAK
jgi:protein-L-isoaspartate O-methyltransferase